jgi:hypothetical protein
MRRAAPILATLLGLLIPALSTAGAQAASPWWGALVGSRPSNLPTAPDPGELQEMSTSTATVEFEFFGPVGEGLLVAPIAVGGEAVGCLAAGEFTGLGETFFHTPAKLCEEETGFPAAAAVKSPAELAALLEGIYGTEVSLSGPGGEGAAPAGFGEGDFSLLTPGRWKPALRLGPPAVIVNPFASSQTATLGAASSEVASEGSGRLNLTFTNLGDAPLYASAEDPLAISVHLPAGVAAYEAEGLAGYVAAGLPAIPCTVAASASLIECSFEGELPPYEAIEVEAPVALDGTVASGARLEASISGGNATALPVSHALTISGAAVHFGIESFGMAAEEEGGAASAQAGVHPFQLTNTLQLNAGAMSGDRRGTPTVAQPALPRNVRVAFPAGLVGAAKPVPACDMATFLAINALINECPADSAVGVASVTFIESGTLGFAHVAVPVFSLPPARGEPARLGFVIAGDPVVIDTSVDPEDEYKVVGEVRNVSQVVEYLGSSLSLWGVPGDPRHDSSRGWQCAFYEHPFGGCPEGGIPAPADTPFLRMPVSCASALEYRAEIEPWNVPVGSVIAPGSAEGAPPVGCNRLPFDPTVSSSLTSKLASNPSGLDLGIQMPNSGLENAKQGAISETQFKRAEVILPKGVTVNPSQAEGLATCSEADYERERFDSKPGEGCPEASKIGSVQITTPLLDEQLEGAVYVATPYQNKTHSLIGLYLVAKIPDRGILVKQPIEVRPDPVTGQLVSIADEVPQLPFSSFKFHFREGGRSPLITPPGCGTFATVAKFVPWSAQNPDNPDPSEVVERQATFTVERGVTGGACPQGPAPFNPGFEAGTLNNQAGSYSPFVMHLTRNDGEQDMGKFSFTLPPGVVGKLAGIPYCPEAGIARAQSRQGAHGGQEEKSDPSCPAASQIGTTVGGAGVGNQLTYVKGSLYLAGPWHGDPLSVVAITPAVAGPFDAGTVVVREALRLNPVTARAEVDGAASDPIPHILKGIPLNLRDLRVYADKPEFTLNATSCEPFKAESTIWGDGTALEPLSPSPADLSSRYQAAGCASLGFKPKLQINLKGGTKRGRFPALKAIATPRPGDANFSRAVVTLPHSAFLEQGHFGTICTRVQFAAAGGNGEACPAASQYGYARAWSPLLAQPLEGPVYLRSSSHNLPDLVVALHGLVDIDLDARIDSKHGGIRSTFADVPDAPVSKFVLAMQGGKKGLIVNSTDLCRSTNRARAKLTGQNGKLDEISPAVKPSCGKKHRKHHRAHHKRKGRR